MKVRAVALVLAAACASEPASTAMAPAAVPAALPAALRPIPSDRDGVRHANKGGQATPVDYAEAKLVIVSASAWVNFIAAKAP